MKLLKVEWLDACQKDLDTDYIESLTSGKELLVVNTTYGKLFKVLEHVIIIEHEHSDNKEHIDCTIIPRCWIIKPKRLKWNT